MKTRTYTVVASFIVALTISVVTRDRSNAAAAKTPAQPAVTEGQLAHFSDAPKVTLDKSQTFSRPAAAMTPEQWASRDARTNRTENLK